jgi:regulator of protease activity HflC (stomatin/prohibitin superfamily)
MATLFAVGVAIVVVVLFALALSLRIVKQYEQGVLFASAG